MAQVTLTFDNGPMAEVTPHVLDVLGAHGIKASFFVIGARLADPEGRKAANRAKAEGHWIGNHSYSHTVSLGDADEAAFDDEVTKTQQEMGDLAHPDKLFRPYCNSGVLDNRVLKRSDVERMVVNKYTCVLFNALTRDWEDGEGWVDTGLKEINSRPWTTLVLHDIPKTGAMRHLNRFVNLVKDEGHEFVQNYSPDSLPILKGDVLWSVDEYVSD